MRLALRVINNWDGASPVALTRDQPVAESIVCCPFTTNRARNVPHGRTIILSRKFARVHENSVSRIAKRPSIKMLDDEISFEDREVAFQFLSSFPYNFMHGGFSFLD